MVNRWVEHVKEFSRQKGVSYGCAVSDPECKSSYVRAPGKTRVAKPASMTKNYRKKVTPEQRERAKVVKQRILDRITY